MAPSTVKMFVLENFNILLRVFYCYGLAPISVKTVDTNLKYFSYIIPVILSSLLSICIVVYLFLLPHLPYGLIGIIINYLTLFTSALMTITATGQCVYHKSIYHQIIHQTQQLAENYRDKFSTQLRLQSIARGYRLKVLLVFAFFFVSQGLVFVEVWIFYPNRSLWLPFLNSLLRSVHPVAVLHFILYCDIAVIVFQEINQKIRSSPISFDPTSKIEFLKNVKLLHMDGWKLVTLINKFFGRNLLWLTIYSFIFITKQVYFVFTVVQVNWNGLALIEGSISVLYGVVTLSVFVSSCQSILFEIQFLIENIQEYVTFWTNDNVFLHQHLLKQELLSQITHLSINISANDFFTIDRKFLAGIIASCCMYIIIFIQFFLAAEK